MSTADENVKDNTELESPAPQPRMIRSINEIPNVLYGVHDRGAFFDMEPSNDDIAEAISSGQLETRAFQGDLAALQWEWKRNSNKNRSEFYRLQRIYHARRIAHFVVHGWTEPIDLTKEGKIRDGLHRFKAAIFLGLNEVEVRIEQ